MITKKDRISYQPANRLEEKYFTKNSIFFDIETTGFSAARNDLYLIGCGYRDDKNFHILEENKLAEVDEDKKELTKEIKDDEIDEEEILFDEKPNRKIVLIVLIILFLIALVIGFLIYKKIIKI